MGKIVLILLFVASNHNENDIFVYRDFNSLEECTAKWEEIKAVPLPDEVENIYGTCTDKVQINPKYQLEKVGNGYRVTEK